MPGLRVAEETFDDVAVEKAPVDCDSHEYEQAKAVAPFKILIGLKKLKFLSLNPKTVSINYLLNCGV